MTYLQPSATTRSREGGSNRREGRESESEMMTPGRLRRLYKVGRAGSLHGIAVNSRDHQAEKG